MSLEVEVGTLRAENAQQKATIEALRKADAKRRTEGRDKVKEAESKFIEAQAELEKLKKEHGKVLKQLEEQPKQVAEENARLKSEIRTSKYRTEFDKLAKEAKADPRALDSLWKLSEVNTDADEIDVEALRGVVTKTLESNPFMRSAGQAQPAVQPGPGGGQGAKVANTPGTFSYTYEQGRDPQFMRANRDRIAEAARNGTLRVVDTPDNFRD